MPMGLNVNKGTHTHQIVVDEAIVAYNSSFSAWQLGPGKRSEEMEFASPALESSIPGSAHYANGSKSEGENNLDPGIPL